MECRICHSEMHEFLVDLRYITLEGHICPECGAWIYDRTEKTTDEKEQSRRAA